MAFLAFLQKKPFDKMSQGEIEKIAPGNENSNISPDFHEISKISDVSPRILVSLKKAEGRLFNRG